MYVYRGGRTHDRLYSHKILVHPVEITFLVPYVAIHFRFQKLHISVVKHGFCLLYCSLYIRVASQVYFFSIVRTACERRIDIHQIDRNIVLAKIGACRYTFATYYKIIGRLSMNFLSFHFIKRHSSRNPSFNICVALIVQLFASAFEIGKHSLSMKDCRGIWNVFYSHFSAV